MTAPPCRMSVADVLGASIVAENRGGATAGYELDMLPERAGIEAAPARWNTWKWPGAHGNTSTRAITRRR